MIKVYRLATGVEIITDTDNADWVNPMVMTATPDGKGKSVINLTPLLFHAKESKCDPNTDHILFSFEPKETLSKLYTETVSQMLVAKSGLVTPTQEDINRSNRLVQ